ncbi:MAG: metal ABC transporter permease [Planctomycetota bacterium]|nr:metal ABC transporter permease [Planctomycetota bacterium]
MTDILSPEGWEILSVAACASLACAVIGPQLILRRRAMLGDAIAHGVLPGLVLGFVFSGSRDLLPMMIGALLAAILVSFLAEWLRDRAGLDGGAALGVVFTTLFAIGIILVEIFARNVDLDPACVLHGMVELAPLDQVKWFGWSIPRSLVPVMIALALNLLVTILLWKEWKVCAFDPPLARSTGLPVRVLEQGLLALVAITSVACFEAVGSVMVIAMLAVPATVAHILANRMGSMVAISMVVGLLSAFIGTVSAERLDTNVPGMMATTSGFLLMGAVLLAPGKGVVPRFIRNMRWSLRVAMEDLLAEAQLCVESSQPAPVRPKLSIGGLATILLEIRGFLRAGKPHGHGQRIAQALLKKRGLWRRFAAERLGLAPDHLDDPAHRIEHHLDEDLTRKIESGLQD